VPDVRSALVTRSGKATLPPAAAQRKVARPARVLAPEVQRGEVPDVSANIYCLGAMLFEAVTGKPFESGQQVRAELNQTRARGKRAKGARSRHNDLLMLAAKATFAQPAARGPDPRKFATSVVVMGGGQVASRHALATWVAAALDGRDVQGVKRPEARRAPVALANAVLPAKGDVVVHAPPIALASTGEPRASNSNRAMQPRRAEPARAGASDSAPARPASEAAPGVESTSDSVSDLAPSEAASALENASDPASAPSALEAAPALEIANDSPPELPASDAAPADESAGDAAPATSELAPPVPRVRPRARKRAANHALLTVVAVALVMAIAGSAQFVRRSAQLRGGSDAAGQSAHEATPGGVRASDGGNPTEPALAAKSAQGAAKPGCPRPDDDRPGGRAGGHSADDKASGAVVLKPVSGAARPRTPQKSESTSEPDYGI